jgi:hypothetical protein
MFLIRTDKQKDSTAKFFYDIAKVNFAALVIAQIANPSGLKFWVVTLGILATVFPFIMAFILDGKEIER